MGPTTSVLEKETNLLLLSSIERVSSAFQPSAYAFTAPYKGVSRARECG